jgi:thymidylate kinase
MWLKIVNPRVLIYLDVDYKTSMQRRYLNLSAEEFDEQVARLSHARENAHIYIDTNSLSPAEVYTAVIKSLADLEFEP